MSRPTWQTLERQVAKLEAKFADDAAAHDADEDYPDDMPLPSGLP